MTTARDVGSFILLVLLSPLTLIALLLRALCLHTGLHRSHRGVRALRVRELPSL
jgi:hypothetical protein